MNYKTLIQTAEEQISGTKEPSAFIVCDFASGTRWLGNQMDSTDIQPGVIKYNLYGLIKYGLSAGAALTFLYYSGWNLLLLPISFVIFYLVEVHFLFLFPLLLDGNKHPLRNSVKAVYKVGLWKALSMTVSIAVYMLSGLLQRRERLHNWYTGCLAILIWYKHDVRDRL
jgi:hypothetical protein